MTIAERIERFVALKNEARSKIHEAALEYVAALDEHINDDVDVTLEFMEATKLSRQSLRIFEDIGRGVRDYRLLFEPASIAKVLEKMPISLQRRILDFGMVDVYEPNSNDMRKVHYKNLDKHQLKMVFTNNNIRDIPAQRNYYEHEMSRLENTLDELENLERGNSYSITRGKLHVKRNTHFTKNQLKNILCRMYGVENFSDIPTED